MAARFQTEVRSEKQRATQNLVDGKIKMDSSKGIREYAARFKETIDKTALNIEDNNFPKRKHNEPEDPTAPSGIPHPLHPGRVLSHGDVFHFKTAGICYKCGKAEGHIARNCPHKP